MKRSERVRAAVKELYLAGEAKPMGQWMWRNHVQWVADKAVNLAKKYQADADKVACAALLHDLADARYERGHADFEAWSEQKGREILLADGFEAAAAREIIEVIIRPHACRPGNLPTTLEGKVLATADALWHLQTSFFPMICYKQKPDGLTSYEAWQEWFHEKIERDFGAKIFFADEKSLAQADYDALTRVFGNCTLNSKEG